MLRRLLLVVVFALCGLLFYGNAQPDAYRLERSAVIAASLERIFPLISDFEESVQWSPRERKDPQMTREYGAATAGPGATYAWSGNAEADTSTVRLQLLPTVDGGTSVVWSMQGENNFLSKLISVLVSIDSMGARTSRAGLRT